MKIYRTGLHLSFYENITFVFHVNAYELDQRLSADDPVLHVYRSGSWKCRCGRAASGRFAGRLRCVTGETRTRDAARAD